MFQIYMYMSAVYTGIVARGEMMGRALIIQNSHIIYIPRKSLLAVSVDVCEDNQTRSP